MVKCKTLKRAPTPLFGRLVKCCAHGGSFVRLRYRSLKRVTYTMLLTQTVVPTFTLLYFKWLKWALLYIYYLVWLFHAVEVHATHQPTPDSNHQSAKYSQGEWPPFHYCNCTLPYGSRWYSKAYNHGSDYTRLDLTSQSGTLASVNASSCQQRHHNQERRATQHIFCVKLGSVHTKNIWA